MADRWMPGAVRVPIAVNVKAGQMGAPVGMVLHHMVGPQESADARFRTPGSGASAHFGVTAEGIVFQWVAIGDAAYHACQANYEGQVGVENESPAFDDPTTADNELWAPLSAAQVTSCANIARWLHFEHGVELRVADPGDRRGIGFHSMCPGDCNAPHAWGRTGCPGAAVADQRDEIVRQAAGAAQPDDSFAEFLTLCQKDDDDMDKYAIAKLSDGRTVIAVRGTDSGCFVWILSADGFYTGPTRVTGEIRFTPTLEAWGGGVCRMYAVGADFGAYEAVLMPGAAAFNGFLPMGGAVAGLGAY